MKYLSLFTGIGGFELGIQQVYESNHRRLLQSETTENLLGELPNTSLGQDRPTCIGFSEIDKYASSIYQSHFPEHKPYGDITKIKAEDLPEFDLIVCGFPCQSFSIAGKRGGFADTRGTLFFDIARIIKAKQPRLLLLENVKGLLSHDKGDTFRVIIATLDELGYDLQWQVLNSKNFGVPQNRERVFIVGHLRGTPRPQVFPFGDNSEKVAQLSGQHSNTLTTRYYGGQANGTYVLEGEQYAQEIVQLNNPVHSNDRVYGTDGLSPTPNTMQGGNRQPFIAAERGRYKEDGSTEQRLEPRKDNISNTLTSVEKDNRVMEDSRIRRLTPTECMRLQGFPDNWCDGGLYDIMEICVNINHAIEKQLLILDIALCTTSDGKGMVIPISQNEKSKSVNIALEGLLLGDIAINIISLGNAMAMLFNQKEILQNAKQLKESLTSEKMVGKSICKLWKVNLVGQYEKEKLPTILTWINETMQTITSTYAKTEENIMGVIILFNSQELNYSNWESLNLRVGNITLVSDSQKYKCAGNAVTVNVIQAIIQRLLL